MTTLPLDIFSDIVEELSVSIPEEHAALRALSLACRALVPICQRVLFRRLDFRSRPRRPLSTTISSPPSSSDENRDENVKAKPDPIAKFDALLSTSPHLAEYVAHLAYLGHPAHLSEPDTLPALARILNSLTHLRSLHLAWSTPPAFSFSSTPSSSPFSPFSSSSSSSASSSTGYFDWSTLATDPRATSFCLAVESALRRDRLVYLSVPDTKNFPFSFFVDKAKLLDVMEDAPHSVRLRVVLPVSSAPITTTTVSAISNKTTSTHTLTSTAPATRQYVQVRNYSAGTRAWPRRMIEVVVAGDGDDDDNHHQTQTRTHTHTRTCLRSPAPGIPPLDLSNTRDALLSARASIHTIEADKILRLARALSVLSYEVRCAAWFRGFGSSLLVGGCAGVLGVLELVCTSDDAAAAAAAFEAAFNSNNDLEFDSDPLESVVDELGVLASPSSSSSNSTSTISNMPALHDLSLTLTLPLPLPLPLDPSSSPSQSQSQDPTSSSPLAASLSRLDLLLTREAFPALRSLNFDFTFVVRVPWTWGGEGDGVGVEGGDADAGSVNGPDTDTGNDGDDTPRTPNGTPTPTPNRPRTTPLPSLKDLEAQHLSYLPSIRAIPGLEVNYSSTLRTVYVDDVYGAL